MKEAQNPQAKALTQSHKPRITDEECEILRPFKDDEELVLALRNLLVGFDLTDKERYTIEDRLDNSEIKRIIKKTLLPQLSPEIPVGQNIDLWMTNDIAEADEDSFELKYRTKALLIELIERGMERLDEVSAEGFKLTPSKDLAFLKARIAYINHITIVLNDLIMNAHRSSGTSDKIKNSNK